MTRQKSFKRLVRARMEKTGESYTAARSMLLAGDEPDSWLATSDERIRERTGRGWEEWFDRIDEWGELTHREIAKRIASELDIDPLAWNAQAITMSYERTRGGRLAGQRDDGFAVTATKTLPVPVEQLFDAFLAQTELRERTSTRPKSARFDFSGGDSRVNAVFVAKGEASSTVSVEHRRLADPDEAERMKAFWRERLTQLAP
jgi:hypothetical protein